jgi:hypothetical protein
MALVMAIVNESHEIGACEHLASSLLHLAIDCELAVKPLNRQIFQFLRKLKSTTLYLL